MPHKRAWVRYIEHKYAVALGHHVGEVEIAPLLATQAEIELIKYRMVRDEGFRMAEPVLAYHGPMLGCFLVDGHTRARVLWDRGRKTVPADLYTSADPAVAEELYRVALEAGGGRLMHVWDVPVVDRLGEGSDAWRRRRDELLAKWDRLRAAAGDADADDPR